MEKKLKTYKCEYDTVYNHCTNHYTLFVEAANLASARQAFDENWAISKHIWQTYVHRKAPHRFHITIHLFAAMPMAEYIQLRFNASMEADAEYWTNKFECNKNQLLQLYGFSGLRWLGNGDEIPDHIKHNVVYTIDKCSNTDDIREYLSEIIDARISNKL